MYAASIYELIAINLLLSSSTITGMTSWPEGRYGLPMATSGCSADSSIIWKTGILYQDCEDTDPQTRHSYEFHLNAVIKAGDVQRSFCMKTSSFNDYNRSNWPSGKYCIYLEGQGCPWGMEVGWIQWDDENTALSYNKNSQRGTLPTGVYDQNTRIYYCCSTRGSAQTPINLPLVSPFYLIAYGSKICQSVRGAKASLEYIYYETEYLTMMTLNDYGGAHPYGATRDPRGHVIFYCYYRPFYCPPLRKPDKGKLKPARCGESNRNTFNDTCVVTCSNGYIPENPSGQIATCLENGTWSISSITGCKPASVNVTSSPSIFNKTGTIQPTTVLTHPSTPCCMTYTTAKSSGIVSAQSLTVQRWSTTVSQASKTTSSTRAQSPTLSSVSSSIPPREEEARSSHKLFLGNNFLIGTAVGAVVLLGLIISLVVLYRRRLKYERPRRGTNARVYMSDLEKSFSMEDHACDRQAMEETSSQENLLYDSLSTQSLDHEEKSTENVLYESCNHRFSVTTVEDNALYESLSFDERKKDEKNMGNDSHLHYKTIT